MGFPPYRNQFFGATDQTAYTAIRSKVDGTSEYVDGVGGQSLENNLENTATLDIGTPGAKM